MDSELGGGGQALKADSTEHKRKAQGGKGRALGSRWLRVQPSPTAHQLCDVGSAGNLSGPQFSHLPNKDSNVAYSSYPPPCLCAFLPLLPSPAPHSIPQPASPCTAVTLPMGFSQPRWADISLIYLITKTKKTKQLQSPDSNILAKVTLWGRFQSLFSGSKFG